MRNTLLEGGGASLIYVRSRRSAVTLLVAGLAGAIAFAALAVVAFSMSGAEVAGFALAGGAAGGALAAALAGRRLRRWPAGKLALFRDRLLVIQDRREMTAVWSNMQSVTLAEPDSWPDIRLTDRLTIQLKNAPAMRFKPAAFGLDPSACRGLILSLRDDPELRSKLPEFDSLRDLAISPVVAGELIEPRL